MFSLIDRDDHGLIEAANQAHRYCMGFNAMRLDCCSQRLLSTALRGGDDVERRTFASQHALTT
jgi:hypothetical protein